MIITNMNSGPKVDYSLSGKTLTIGDTVHIELEDRQKEVQNVVDVCLDNQLKTMREGMGAWYVATIILPPKQKELIADGEDEDGNEEYKEVERPLDLAKVELRLWTLPEGYQDPQNTETEETAAEEGGAE